jgi:hypothetical protein
VHCRLKSSGDGAVALGQYRIDTSLDFDCVYYDDEQKVNMSIGEKQLSGIPVANSGQWLDCILYTTEQNSAVYAVVCDNESGSIAYAAYQIPDRFAQDVIYAQNDGAFTVNIMTFSGNENGSTIIIDSVNVAEGSLKQYLKENMAAYAKHRSKVDAFLSRKVTELPEMFFKPAQ